MGEMKADRFGAFGVLIWRSGLAIVLAGLLWVGLGRGVVRAELPPGSYDRLRSAAGEVLVIEVTGVVRRAGVRGEVRVTVQARVLMVERSVRGLRRGDVVTIRYGRSEGVVGPRQVGVLEKGVVYPAFLRWDGGAKGYEPAAYGESFRMTPEG